MVRIKSGCKELNVSEDIVEKYLRDGWKVVGAHGEEIVYTKPMTYEQAVNRIKELENYQNGLRNTLNEAAMKIKTLEAENQRLKKRGKNTSAEV